MDEFEAWKERMRAGRARLDALFEHLGASLREEDLERGYLDEDAWWWRDRVVDFDALEWAWFLEDHPELADLEDY